MIERRGGHRVEETRGGNADPSDRYSAIAASLILGVTLLSPLPLGSNRPLIWSIEASVIGLAVAFLAASGRLADDRSSLGRLKLPAMLLTAVVLWMLLQAVSWTPSVLHHSTWSRLSATLGEPVLGAISASPVDTLYAVLRWCSLGAVFLVMAAVSPTSDLARRNLIFLAVGAGVYAVAAMVMHHTAKLPFGIVKWSYFDLLTGPFVNPNSFATWLGMALAVSTALLLSGGEKSRRFAPRLAPRWYGSHLLRPATVLVGLSAIATMLALLVTGSRAGIAATGFGVAVVLLLFAVRAGGRGRGVEVIALLLIVLLAGGLTYFLSEVLRGGEQGASSDAVGRFALWRDTLSAIEARPWLGHGGGAFGDVFGAYLGSDTHPGRSFQQSHNSYLELVAELGVPAALVVFAAFVILAFGILRGAFKRRLHYGAPLAATGAIAVVAAHALFDFSIQIYAVAIYLAAITGVGFAQAVRNRSDKVA